MKSILALITFMIMFGLTGCSSTTIATSSVTEEGYMKHPLANNTFSPTLVASAGIANQMQPADKAELVHLLSTAKPKQTVTWKNNDGDYFELDSLNISVDEHGWPCRRYQMRALIRGYEEKMPEMTACRMDDGNWAAA